MQNAAERLLVLKPSEIQELAKDILFGQLRLVIATMEIEEINTDRDKFLEAVSRNVESELKKIGLRLINVNLTDINDESGYIQALGKEAAAKAINDARKSVAEKTRDGSIGEANALKEQRISVADANSLAVDGENLAFGKIAQSNAIRMATEAEAEKNASVARQRALEETFAAQQKSETARAERELATLRADEITKAEIEKDKKVIEAEAMAEQTRRVAQGRADAIYAELEATAKGNYEILAKQAQGFSELVAAANNSPEEAVKLLIADKLERLVDIQVKAISNLKFDKITVWDTGSSSQGFNNSSTANFAQSLFKSIPPLTDLFESCGMKIPSFMGSKTEADPEPNKS
jgi:flotillin